MSISSSLQQIAGRVVAELAGGLIIVQKLSKTRMSTKIGLNK